MIQLLVHRYSNCRLSHRQNCDIFTFKVTNVENAHHQQQCIVDSDVQQIGRRSVLLLTEQRQMQFQLHASGLAVCVVLRCKQHSLEIPIGESVMVLGRMILVDLHILHFPVAHKNSLTLLKHFIYQRHFLLHKLLRLVECTNAKYALSSRIILLQSM
jgi:hypothetical protein